MDSFRRNAWNLKPQGRDGNYQRYAFGNGGAAKVLDVYIDEDERPGTWALGEGQVHHAAFEVADLDVQAALKFDVEGLGYTDFSDRKHRGYFESIRSDEHTSELQSLMRISYAVFCFKKKKTLQQTKNRTTSKSSEEYKNIQ